MKNSIKNSSRLYSSSIFKGVINAFLITLVLLLFLGSILYFTKTSESIIPSSMIVVSCFSILLGGANATKSLEKLGWLHGGLIGFLYIGILILLSIFFMPPVSFGWSIFIDLALGFIVGVVAGALGVNL